MVRCRQAQKVLVVASVWLISKELGRMKLLLVMLLVSGLLIGESRAQAPFVRFFGNLYTNFRSRVGLGCQSTSTASQSTVTVTTTAIVTTTVIDSTSIPNYYGDVGLASPDLLEPEISTETASADWGMSTTMDEAITEGASTDSPLIMQNDLPVESSTPAEDNQVELEIVTEGPELDHSDATVIEAMAQIMLEIPTTTPESLTTQSVDSETEAIVVKDDPAVVKTTSSSTTSFLRDSTAFATLAPKRTIHFSKPSWTPTFLKLANRGSTSRYFFPASFKRPKADDDSGFFEKEKKFLSPSKPSSVENSAAPRIPYVVKRNVDIESSMTVLNQQQSSVLIARAATD